MNEQNGVQTLRVLIVSKTHRVSLARWWRPEDDPGCQNRCYVQLSGWYQPQCMADRVLVA